MHRWLAALQSSSHRRYRWPTARLHDACPFDAYGVPSRVGLQRTDVIDGLERLLGDLFRHSVSHAGWVPGITVALAGNLINNLPAGLIAGSAVDAAHAPDRVANAVLIGIDLGPNLSITGSLATILWLMPLRRESVGVGALGFLKLGIAVMLSPLAAALGALQLAWLKL